MERRAFQLNRITVRQDGDASKIAGHAAVYNSLSVPLGGFRERISVGAFADSIDSDVFAFWQHDSTRVLGRTRAGTLQLREDEQGLAFELTPPNNTVGRDALESIGRGDVDKMSFGFTVPKGGDEWDEDDSGMVIRTLHHVNLIEVSPVTFPAYADTTADIVRSAPEWVQRALTQEGRNKASNQARARIDLLRRKLDLAHRMENVK